MKMGKRYEEMSQNTLKLRCFQKKNLFLENWKRSISEFQNKNIHTMNFNQMFQSNLAYVSRKINMFVIL